MNDKVKEEGGAEESSLHLRWAAGGEVDDEAVAVGEHLFGHIGGGLRDAPQLLPLHIADDKLSLGRTFHADTCVVGDNLDLCPAAGSDKAGRLDDKLHVVLGVTHLKLPTQISHHL